MEKKNINSGLQYFDEHKHTPKHDSVEHEMLHESMSTKNQCSNDLPVLSITEFDLPQEQRVDNRLRAIFGKIAPQLFTFLNTDPVTCFSYLKDACAAEDANDRAAYLHVISQIWDRIQIHRQNSRKRTKPGNSSRMAKRVKKLKPIVEEVDEETPALAQKQSAFEASNILNERDLLWIVKYAEFGRLLTQLTKAASDDLCLVVLGLAKSADEHKNEFHYDLAIDNVRRILKSHEMKLADILYENTTQGK